MATINGTAGDDTLLGTADPDTLRGLGGDDTLDGGAGPDSLDGGDGNDRLTGEAGDTLKGAEGDDTFVYNDGSGVPIDFTAMTGIGVATVMGVRVSGFEKVEVYAGGLNDHIVLGDVGGFVMAFGGNDTVIGGAGHDYIRGGLGDDSLDGGRGIDRIGFFSEAAANGCTVDLRLQGQAQNTGAGMDVLLGFENVSGTANHDVIIGDGNVNILWGSGDGTVAPDGSDVISANGGDDLVISSDGNHTLNGGDGNDTLSLFGNSTDTSAGVTISLGLQGPTPQDTGVGLMVIRNFENLDGSIHGDALTGDQFANRLAGEGGDDTLRGGGSADNLYGDGSIGPAWPYALSGPVGEFIARYEPDVTPGSDVLDGGKGNDMIVGGGEADDLTGGGGSDQFRYSFLIDSLVGEEDVIHDFSAANDVLDVEGIDADETVAGDQAFTLVGSLTGVAGQAALVYSRVTGITTVLLDVDGDAEADAQVFMEGRFTVANMSDGAFLA